MRLLSDLMGTLKNSFSIGKATLLSSALTVSREINLPDSSGTLLTDTDLSAYSKDLDSKSSTETTGAKSLRLFTMNVDPADNSTLQFDGAECKTVFNGNGGNKQVQAGGWVGCIKGNINFAANSAIDKAVVNTSFAALGSGAQIDKLLMYEAVVNSIDASANINAFCGYYFPNLTGVPNIGRIVNMFSFGCDHPDAHIKTASRYLKAMHRESSGILKELAPAHPGLMAGRYYGPALRDAGTARKAQALTAGVAHIVPIFIPHRCTINTIGIVLSTAAAGKNIKFALYFSRDKGAGCGYKIYESGNISLSATGNKEVTGLSIMLEAGVYFICVLSDAAASVQWSKSNALGDYFGCSGPTGVDMAAGYSTGYITLPADASSVTPTFSSTGGFVPDVYWKVS